MSRSSSAQGRTASQKRGGSIWTVQFIALIVVNFLMTTGQMVANTVVPLYAYDLGASAAIVGFISGAFAVTALIVRPFAGPAFDSFSEKKLFAGAVLVLAFASVSYGFMDSVEGLIAFRFVHGLGMGFAAPLGLAIASQSLPQDKMNSGIGYYSIAQAAAQAIGPAVGIWLSRQLGYTPTFLLTGFFLLGSFVVIIIFIRDPFTGERPPYQLKLSRAFAKQAVGITIVLMLMSVANCCTSAFMAIYGELQGVADIGLYFTVYAIVMVASRPFAGRLADKYGANKILYPAFIMFIISFVLVGMAHSLPMFLLAAVFGALGYGVASPIMQAITFKCVPSSRRGSASNTSFMGFDFGFLIGPFIGGVVVDNLTPALGSEVAGYSWMWIVMIIPIVAGMIAYRALKGSILKYEAEVEKLEAEAASSVLEVEDDVESEALDGVAAELVDNASESDALIDADVGEVEDAAEAEAGSKDAVEASGKDATE